MSRRLRCAGLHHIGTAGNICTITLLRGQSRRGVGAAPDVVGGDLGGMGVEVVSMRARRGRVCGRRCSVSQGSEVRVGK